jgi:hypothetical protein
MAREANLAKYGNGLREGVTTFIDALERFEALVRADERSVEREACAKVCEIGVDYEHPTVKGHIMENFGHSRLLAKAIRERSANAGARGTHDN